MENIQIERIMAYNKLCREIEIEEKEIVKRLEMLKRTVGECYGKMRECEKIRLMRIQQREELLKDIKD